jgi:hypothetical protein
MFILMLFISDSLKHTIFSSWRHMSRGSIYCYRANKVSAELDTNTAVVCELEAHLGQHVCLKHTDICSLRFHVDRMSRNSTVTDLSCWHKRYCFWLLHRSIRFVLQSKHLLQWLRCFTPTQALVTNSRVLPRPAASIMLFTIHYLLITLWSMQY